MDFSSFSISLLYAVREMSVEELPSPSATDRALIRVAEEARGEGMELDIPAIPGKGDCPLCMGYWDDLVSISHGRIKMEIGTSRLARIAFCYRVRDERERDIFKRMAGRLFDVAYCLTLGEGYDTGRVVEEDALAF
jgi:hypothetical protein